MDNSNYKNTDVEDFFLNRVHDVEGLPMDQCSFLLNRYYQEACNPENFPSSEFIDQDERIEKMFPGAPEPVKNLLKFKSYQHQLKKLEKDGVKDEKKEKRVKELEPIVAASEYAEFTTQQWWNL